ncbi:MAG TPA: acylphosphatase [Candidatus Sulfotelmatobacter sp.]|nr:acylphosphatase [Candidatus Sulfotelmatobacter sp.]
MQARIYVLGFVQGVGFRQFVKKNAQKLSLVGSVKNLSDGRVEIVANGTKENIEKLLKICEKGTFFSDVKSVQIDWEEEQSLKNFEILH